MTRIAIIADSHFDEHSRFEECKFIHDWMAVDMQRRDVDLVLHAGDVFERKSTPAERAAFADWVQQVADFAPMVIVRGNHDALGDLPIFARLNTRHAVVVEEAANVHVFGNVAVACLAWPRKAELLARLPQGVGHAESEDVARDALRWVIRGLGAELANHEGPSVMLTHAMVSGSVTSTGQPLVGCDLEVTLDDLSLAGADFYALGHIHKPQAWELLPLGSPVAYPGSPRRTAFGEVEDKGYILLDIDEAGRVAWFRVKTPARRMVLLASAERALTMTPESVEGAEVRLRYTTPSDQREAARADANRIKAQLLELGAFSVKVEEEVVATVRARAPEVAEAQTIGEKLRALWALRGDVPDEERAGRLIGLANQLEEEVRNAS